MPVGRVRWFDPKSGQGRIVHSGRDYPVDVSELDRHARFPRARVRFDVSREGGIARAVHARLLAGTRTNRRQGRFGDLTGATHPDAKGRAPLTHRHPDLQAPIEAPLDLVRRWAEALERGDVVSAARLYAPEARLHGPGETVTGRARIHGYLGKLRILGRRLWNLEVRGAGEDTLVRWGSLDPDVPAGSARARVAHGEIIEQWIHLGSLTR